MKPDDRQPTTPEDRDPRVYLAEERTMLAWVRTGLAMMGFGFVVARFGLFLRELTAARALAEPQANALPHHPMLSLWAGTALVALGVWVNVAAAIRHARFRRGFERGEPFATPPGTPLLVVAGALTAIGAFMAIYLVVVGH